MALLLLINNGYAACEIIDDAGQRLSLKHPALRIISLAPDITEDLFAIGVGNRVIGVMKGSDYPPAARRIAVIGSYSGLDLEKIAGMHPDLIVVWNHTFMRELRALKRLNISIYSVNPTRLEDVAKTMKNLGCLTGMQVEADAAGAAYMRKLGEVRQQYRHLRPLNVFYQIGAYSLITINKDNWINQALALCGGKNIFAHMRTPAPEVTWEAVVLANPQVIITDVEGTEWQSRWQRWPGVAAVKNRALYSVNPDLIERASPRLLEGVKQLCEVITKEQKQLIP